MTRPDAWPLPTAPATNAELREALYAGEVFLLEATAASERFVREVRALLDEVFAGCGDRRLAHALGNAEFFRRVGLARRRLFTEPRYRRALVDVVAALGFEPADVAIDPARVRAIAHRGHDNPAAAPVYYAHRDTWYAHPQAMLTWWIPLDDLGEDETFVFYPERFARPVPNDSEVFDYAAWVRDGPDLRIGWQDEAAGHTARYPGVTAELDAEFDPGPERGFSCRRGQNLLFSGAHFHRTLRQESGRTRYSLDFRLVHLGDHERGRGAPNCDNRSRGSALVDYWRPGDRGQAR